MATKTAKKIQYKKRPAHLPTDKPAGGISAAAVKKATGKTWKQWFAILDRGKSSTKKHKEIAAWLSAKYPDVGGWWCQMFTVAVARCVQYAFTYSALLPRLGSARHRFTALRR